MQLSQIKKNKRNPRNISAERIDQLCKSLTEFPDMMRLRPIVVDANNMILGGNMRFEALKRLGYTEVSDEWVKRADELTDEQKREFVIKDNANFGEWDWELLANEWDDLPLADWGVDVPVVANSDDTTDLSDTLGSMFVVEVMCADEQAQQKAYEQFTEWGYQCRILTL